MEFRSLGLATGVLFAACSCSTLSQSKSVKWPWSNGHSPCSAHRCQPAEAVQAFVRASEFCRDVQNYYESRGFYSESGRFGIGLVGVLAGAVGAPLSTGAASKAWTSVSGATNGLQMQMDTAFSGAVSAKRRATIATAYNDAVKDYKSIQPVWSAPLKNKSDSFDKWPKEGTTLSDWEPGVGINLSGERMLVEDSDAKVITAVHMAARCAMGAGQADQQALKSLTAD